MKPNNVARSGLIACALLATAAGCLSTDEGESTLLNPEGPPMIQQVLMEERVVIDDMGTERVRRQLAFGTHPDVADLDSAPGVNTAIARDNQRIRVVFDELLLGNYIEEIACDAVDADGQVFSKIPPNATPDDLVRCSGADLFNCTGENAICVVDGAPVGILDVEQNGSPDAFRLIRYEDGELAVRIFCDGGDGTLGNGDDVSIPINRNTSFYNPSGNQLVPAGPCGLDCLGPALIVIPEDGMRTSAQCGMSFQDLVVDKDLNTVCAPADGDVSNTCTPGDTSLISWTVEPLRLVGNFPDDGATGVDPNTPLLLIFNASMDVGSLSTVTLEDSGNTPIAVTWALSADDPKTAEGTLGATLAANETYTLTVPTTVTDRFGGALPAAQTITFTTLP